MKNLLFIILLISVFPILGYSQSVPPGIVINHIPKQDSVYIGSPAICILPNGDYIVSHDLFGPKSNPKFAESISIGPALTVVTFPPDAVIVNSGITIRSGTRISILQ